MCPDEPRLKTLDKALWENPEDGSAWRWLPHGTAADGDPDLQPVWLSTAPEPANGARYLFLVHGAVCTPDDRFDRVFDLFDGNDPAATDAARERWRQSKEAGHTPVYWKQGPRGWERGE